MNTLDSHHLQADKDLCPFIYLLFPVIHPFINSQPSLPSFISKVSHYNSFSYTFNDHFIKLPWETKPSKTNFLLKSRLYAQRCMRLEKPARSRWVVSHAAHGHEPQAGISGGLVFSLDFINYSLSHSLMILYLLSSSLAPSSAEGLAFCYILNSVPPKI